MARTTGYTCVAAANLLLTEGFARKGVCPPEYIGDDPQNLAFLFSYLEERGVTYRKNIACGERGKADMSGGFIRNQYATTHVIIYCRISVIPDQSTADLKSGQNWRLPGPCPG